MDINTGRKIENDVCEVCKEKIIEMTKRVSKFDMIRPNKMAHRFAKILCNDCQKRVMRRLGK